MKPSRKVTRGSFMSRISGGNGSGSGGKRPPVPPSDHDLAALAKGESAATDADQ